jgi:L-seryl-tRNA(Ser) seleniumtransferase
MADSNLRKLPSIDQLLHREGLQIHIAENGRDAVRDALREALSALRMEISGSNGSVNHDLDQDILDRVESHFSSRRRARTRGVINATGVILHTNLGRAPLSARALEAIDEVAFGYCNLEYDLQAGRRGKRGVGLEAQFRALLGVEGVAVVNNCAAAVLLTLNTLAEGGEVIVSRGELVEIGGGFRIPDVITKSGAHIREVGTTNRTRIDDYEQAINEQTRVILRVHPSNYRIIGFTEKPSLAELAALARRRNLPLYEDIGGGSLTDFSTIGIHDEPSVADSIKAGVSLVSFSGGKLLGGPQAGIILGETALVGRIKSNPLMRALRVDKLTYAALEATVDSYASGRAREEIPVLASLFASKEEIARRAQALLDRIETADLDLDLIEGDSVIGGGAAPQTKLPTTLIRISSKSLSPQQIEEFLRNNFVPIIVRIWESHPMIDLRTVLPSREEDIIKALVSLDRSSNCCR